MRALVALKRRWPPLAFGALIVVVALSLPNTLVAAKTLHLIAVISWFAGLFYLPRLFVYHAMASERSVTETLKVMERKLFHFIMTPAALVVAASGVWLAQWFAPAPWLWAKLGLVAALWCYHIVCWRLMVAFREGRNRRSHRFYRLFNELPTLLLIGIVLLAVAKPGLG